MKSFFMTLLGCGVCAVAASAADTNPVRTLTLPEARATALRLHPQLAAASYRALAAEQAVRQARAGFFPAANLYGTATGVGSDNTRILAGGLNNPSVMDRTAGGLGVSQLITDFGRTANLTASSSFQAQAENQNASATREQVLLQVDTDYFAALQAQALLRVAAQTVDTRQLLVDQVSLLASNKLKSDLDVSFAQVALEEGRLLLQRAQSDADAAQASLSTALGYREFHPFQLVEQTLPAADATNGVYDLIQAALQARPELLALRDQRDAALRFAQAEKDARYPSLAAVGAAGGAPTHDARLPDNYVAGGVQLSLPLFAGGLYTARQHEAELRAQAAAELLRSMEDIVVRDVRIAWLNLNNAVQRLYTTEQLLRHATEAYELADARYRVGSSSIVELSQAQLELMSAQIANTDARYDVLIQRSNLDYQIGALGTGRPNGG
jgi:outer membrane protein